MKRSVVLLVTGLAVGVTALIATAASDSNEPDLTVTREFAGQQITMPCLTWEKGNSTFAPDWSGSSLQNILDSARPGLELEELDGQPLFLVERDEQSYVTEIQGLMKARDGTFAIQAYLKCGSAEDETRARAEAQD